MRPENAVQQTERFDVLMDEFLAVTSYDREFTEQEYLSATQASELEDD